MNKTLRRLTVCLGIILLSGAALVVFLPALASTAPVRKAILNRLQAATGARIAVDDWSLSWLNPQHVVNALYEDDDAGISFELKNMTVSRGLLSIARNRDAGDIVLEHPRLTVRLISPDLELPTPVPDDVPDDPPDVPLPPRDPEAPVPEAPAPFTLPDFVARLVCHNGKVIIENEDRLMVLGDLELVIDRQRDPAPITVQLSGRQMTETGTVNVDIQLTPAKAAGEPGSPMPTGEIAIRLSQWDMTSIGRVARAVGSADWAVSGMMTLDADYRLTGDVNDIVSMNFAVADFRIAADGKELLADEKIELVGSTGLNLTDQMIAIDDGEATFAALGSSGRLHFRNLLMQAGDLLPSGDLSLEIASDLARLLPFVADSDIGDLLMAGQARLRGDFQMQDNQLSWDDLQADISDFSFTRETLRYAVSNLALRTRGRTMLTKRNVNIEDFVIEGLPGRVQGNLQIADWDLLPGGLVMQLDALLSMEDAMTALAGTEGLDTWSDGGGTVNAQLQLASSADDAWELTLDSEITSLRIPMADGTVFSEDHVELAGQATIDVAGNITFDPLTLNATALGITVAGEKVTIDDQMHLRCHGMLRYDLAALTQLAADRQTELPLTVRGRAERPFSLDIPLNETWLSAGTADAELYVEHIEGYGLQAGPLNIPLTLRDGIASLVIETEINEGKLDLRPRLQQMNDRLVLTLPADSTILRDMRLTETIADELLALLHPIFKGAVVTKGFVDLTFDTFHIPIAEDAMDDIRFNGTLRLKDVDLEATRLLDQAREMVRIRESIYRLGSHDLRFACANGRVTTEPLRLTVDRHPMQIAGSMGLDETLDYTVSTPVTERLVGRDFYDVLRDSTITIPVRGTVSRPRLGEEEVRAAVADLVRQAGRKAIERGAEQLLRRLLE